MFQLPYDVQSNQSPHFTCWLGSAARPTANDGENALATEIWHLGYEQNLGISGKCVLFSCLSRCRFHNFRLCLLSGQKCMRPHAMKSRVEFTALFTGWPRMVVFQSACTPSHHDIRALNNCGHACRWAWAKGIYECVQLCLLPGSRINPGMFTDCGDQTKK